MIGVHKFGTELVNSGVLPAGQLAYDVGALPAGACMWATLLTEIGGAWSRYQAIPFCAAQGKALFTAPTNGQVNVSATQTFSWTTISQAQALFLVVGTAPYGKDVINSGVLPGTQTSFAPTGALPGSKKLYATLLTEVNGAWTRYQAIAFTTQ